MKTYLSKKYLAPVVGAALVSAAALFATGANAAETKIGVIDVNRIITEAKAAKDINKQMEQFRKDYQAKISSQEKSLRAEEKKLAEQQKTLSPKEFNVKKKAFEGRVVELQKEIMAQNQALQQAAQSAMEKIRSNVIEISEIERKKRGFSMNIPSTVPVSFDPAYDITSEVISQLNSKLPGMKVDFKPVKGNAMATKKS